MSISERILRSLCTLAPCGLLRELGGAGKFRRAPVSTRRSLERADAQPSSRNSGALQHLSFRRCDTRGEGHASFRIGRRVRYRMSDVIRYVEENSVTTTESSSVPNPSVVH